MKMVRKLKCAVCKGVKLTLIPWQPGWRELLSVWTVSICLYTVLITLRPEQGKGI